MLVVLKQGATSAEVDAVCDRFRELGFAPHPMPGPMRVAIGITDMLQIGARSMQNLALLEALASSCSRCC